VGAGRGLAASAHELERRDLLSLTPIPTSVNLVAGMVPAAAIRVGAFIDSDPAVPGDFTSTIDWGDGHSSAGTIRSMDTSGRFEITGTNLYRAPNSYTVKIQVKDYHGNSTTVDSTAFVSAPALSPVGSTAAFTAGVQPTAPVAVGSFFDSNPGALAGNFTSTITWGDGHTSTGIVAPSSIAGLFTVSGTNVYTSAGIFPISISVQDNLGNTTGIMSTALVSANQATGFTGGLTDSIVNGPLSANGYTSTNRPTFSGTAPPFSIVRLYARYLSVDAPIALGEAVTSASGQWTLTTGPLATGSYIVTATVTIPGGYPSSPMTLSNRNGTDIVYVDLAPAKPRPVPHHPRAALHLKPKLRVSHPMTARRTTPISEIG
jgi:hypothetical protein